MCVCETCSIPLSFFLFWLSNPWLACSTCHSSLNCCLFSSFFWVTVRVRGSLAFSFSFFFFSLALVEPCVLRYLKRCVFCHLQPLFLIILICNCIIFRLQPLVKGHLPSKVDENGILVVDRGHKKNCTLVWRFFRGWRGAYAPLKPPLPLPLYIYKPNHIYMHACSYI